MIWNDFETVRPSAGEIFLISDGINLAVAKMSSYNIKNDLKIRLMIIGTEMNLVTAQWASLKRIKLPKVK